MKIAANVANVIAALLLAACAVPASAAGRLVIEQAWIRAAPPSATMLAGYATLRNGGDAPVIVTGAVSDDFGDVSLHLSHVADGLVRMEPIKRVEIAPGSYVVLAPGSYHLMLMGPKRELKQGDAVKIRIATETGDSAFADFVVRDDAP